MPTCSKPAVVLNCIFNPSYDPIEPLDGDRLGDISVALLTTESGLGITYLT